MRPFSIFGWWSCMKIYRILKYKNKTIINKCYVKYVELNKETNYGMFFYGV